MDFVSVPVLMAIFGCIGGIVLGLAARVGRFCTLGSLEDAYYGGDFRRLRAWALAIAVSMLCVQIMDLAGLVSFQNAIYLTPQFGWLGAILGGLMFGIGMALAGTCGYGNLARIGGGDLRAIVVFLVFGVTAYMTLSGLTAIFRVAYIEPVALDLRAHGSQSLGDIANTILLCNIKPFIGIGLAILLLAWSFKDAGFRAQKRLVLAGFAVGLTISAAWLVTGTIGQDAFTPQRLEAYSFAAPVGRALMYAMTFSGSQIDFAIGGVVGVVLGAFIGALFKGEFRWEACDDVRELRRHMTGAFLMGTGGVLALGCTIGQGISAMSVLAISGPIVMLAIACGAKIGLGYLIEGNLSGSIRHLFSR